MGGRVLLISLILLSGIHSVFLNADAMFEEITLFEDTNGACAIAAADFNNDDHPDLVYTCFPLGHIQWLENDGDQNFTPHMVIEGFVEAKAIDVADIDQDGFTDFAATANAGDKISWFCNDQNGDFVEHIVTTEWDGPGFVLVTDYSTGQQLDINGDGEVDILATACNQGRIGWFENDGSENFTEHLLMDDWTVVSGAAPADLDSDGDVDILAAAQEGGICWFENINNEFTLHTLFTDWDKANWVVAGFINDDEYMDFAATSCGTSDAVAWFENDGSQQFEMHLLKDSYNGARCPILSDIDDDGDLDIFSIGWQEAEGNFFENRGNEIFREQVISNEAYDMLKYFVIDLDSDDDLDLVASTAVYGNHHIRVFDNRDSFLEADFSCDTESGHAPLNANFSTSVYSKPEVNFYGWDFENNGGVDSFEAAPEFIYQFPGQYSVCLMISNGPESVEILKEDLISVFDGESALLFDNTNNNAVVPASASLALENGFTLEAFTIPDDYGMNPNFGFGRVFDKGAIEVFLCNFFPLYNSECVIVNLEHSDGTVSCHSTPEQSLDLLGGRHIAVSYNNADDLKIYINGNEQTLTIYEGLSGALADHSEQELHIGNTAETNNSFCGVIDEARIWNRVLSEAEINAGLSGYLNGNEEGLAAYYHFNEGCGSIFYDETENHNNGQLENCTWTQGDPFDLTGSEETVLPDVEETVLKAYPNPFNPSTTISFNLNKSVLRSSTTAEGGEITKGTELSIYNLKGQKIKTYIISCHPEPVEGDNSRKHSVIWNGTDDNNNPVSSGIYLYKLSIGGKPVAVKKGMLLK